MAVARAKNRLPGKQPKLAEPAQKSPLRSGGRNTFENELNLLASGFPTSPRRIALENPRGPRRRRRQNHPASQLTAASHRHRTSPQNTTDSECSSTTATSASSNRPPPNSPSTPPATTNPRNHKTPSRRRANCERCPEPSMNDDPRHPAVREGGLEPPCPHGHTDLNRARLPISPLALTGRITRMQPTEIITAGAAAHYPRTPSNAAPSTAISMSPTAASAATNRTWRNIHLPSKSPTG
ncbi:MAG: hypothetical protein JWQ12_851 [Glaciihabitans sp.]|nr:hypothetical protein [Glaciihabitans sp.]